MNRTPLERAALNEPNMTLARRHQLERMAQFNGDDYDEETMDEYNRFDDYEEYKDLAINHLRNQ